MERTADILTISQQKEELLWSRIHEVNQLIDKDNEISEKSVLEQLVEILCNKFPMDFLNANDAGQILEFTKQRFDFMERSFTEKVSVSVSPFSIDSSGNKKSSVVLEFILKERPFIVDSLTEYVHWKKHNLSLMLYPIIALESTDDDKISAIKKTTEETTSNYTYCCCIIDNFNAKNLQDLKDDVFKLLLMVCCVTDDFTLISQAIEEYSLKDKKNESESLLDSERRRLFTWFNTGNVILLASGELLKEDVSPQLSWDKFLKPQGYFRRKMELNDSRLPNEIGRLGSFFLESGLNINIIEIAEPSVVHRRGRIQVVFRKRTDEDGNTRVGVFYILFTNKSRKEAAMAIPLARLKVNAILENLVEGENVEGKQGHLHKVANDFFSIIPKSELFRLDRPELAAIFEQYLFFGDFQSTKLSTFSQPERRYARLTFCMPNHRFSPEIFDRIDQTLSSQLECDSEIKYCFDLGRNAYSHHVFWFPPDHPQLASIDLEALEQEVASFTIGWEEEFQLALKGLPSDEAATFSGRYAKVFGDFYQAVFTPLDALKDIGFLETLLRDDREQVDLRSDLKKDESVIYIFTKRKYHLTEVMPHLQNLSLTVIDENTYELAINSSYVYIYTYYVKSLKEPEGKFEDFKGKFCDLLLAVLEKRTEDDILNGLLLAAGLNKEEINLFILYRYYYWQIGAPYLPVNKSFLENPQVIMALKAFFTDKFDPQKNVEPLDSEKLSLLRDKALIAIDKVTTVAEDIVFKTILNLMEATIRTNYFYIDPSSAMAVKIESAKVERMTSPRPLYEIYVHGADMEGIHLRGAMIARGGLRHSDRPADFRSEILGLMNTQMLKNVVIVPEGSKGGFITKTNPSDRGEQMAEVEKQYKIYINSLLSLTDNIVDGQVVPAKNVVRYDEDDPYLVVAADKGTATLSDTANEISESRGFWLRDAFASGGRHGYDHKGMAITARGAWESVKLHFLQEGKDIQTTDFTVVGIGDMSGDVFGNGMLLSRHIRLLGAFNHIHIFVDPDPDPETTFKERERLFQTPGSTWMDYDQSLISQGGGIFKRAAKTIDLSPEAKKMLGVSDDTVSGEVMIQLLLKCETDLLWNGGIGTYVKASTETANDVRDAANDAVRIDAKQLRSKVLGEGGNLGLTQRARVEAAEKGLKLNTDAIDNSGGVDTSDHEVNLKILMESLISDGQIPSLDARNTLLEDLTDDIAELVLVDNISQGQILSMDSSRSKKNIKPIQNLIGFLTDQGLMDPKGVYLSTNEQLEEYFEKGIGIPRPDLSLLLSFTKMYFYKQIVQSDTLDDPYLEDVYYNYFPKAFRDRFDITKFPHPLKKEIIGTVLVNKTINQAGITFLPDILSLVETNAVDIVVAYTVVDRIFNLDDSRRSVMDELRVKNINSAYTLLIRIEQFIRIVLTWMLMNFDSKDLKFSMVEDYQKLIVEFLNIFEKTMDPDEKRQFQNTCENLMTLGVSAELARNLASGEFMRNSLEIIVQAQKAGISLDDATTLSLGIDSMFHFRKLHTRVMRLETDSDWAKKHKALLVKQMQSLKQEVSANIISQYKDVDDYDDKLQQFMQKNKTVFKNYQIDYGQLIGSESIELSGVAILFDAISGLLN
ncbi:MAG: NAD-glutamate dehydrogenase [Proteobacteria bacterium]|nr:NAD-glutamate dehydrogenase [Pseudomonadota bacterium]